MTAISPSATTPSQSVESLVQSVQRGDRAAFEQLYRLTRPGLARLIEALLGNASATEDLLQEAYVLVWTKIRVLREPATFGTWLRRIAVNLCLRRREQHHKKGWNLVVDPDLHGSTQAGGDPAAVVPGLLDLRAGLDRLPETDRALLILRELHGCSYDEMAEILSLPVGTVRSRLHASRKKILRELQEKGATV